jgi:hypothetical protein
MLLLLLLMLLLLISWRATQLLSLTVLRVTAAHFPFAPVLQYQLLTTMPVYCCCCCCCCALQIRTPYITPTAAYITDPAFTILDAPSVSVIDPATNASVSITNPLASWGASTRSASWKANLAANAVSWSSQLTSFIASPDWGCTWGGGWVAVPCY